MNIDEMERCLLAIADYMKNKDESPIASEDLLYIARYIREVQEKLDWLNCLEDALGVRY